MTYQQPDAKGFYGKLGGQFVPETLMTAVIELDKAYREAKEDPSFQAELDDLLKNYVGRETPLYHAKRLTDISVERKFILNVRILTTQVPTRLTMPLVKSCLPNVWARRKSSPKLVQVNTVLQQRQPQPFSIWIVQYIWVKKMLNVRRLTFSVWNCLVPRY